MKHVNVRKDFPILNLEENGKKLIYFDNAATSQKPETVLRAMDSYYRVANANINRGAHFLADKANNAYCEARKKVADFIGAERKEEIVFTKNATEAINLVAETYGRYFLRPGDAVLLSKMEHHSNLIPWLKLAAEKKLEIRYLNTDKSGRLCWKNWPDLIRDGKIKLLALTAISNVLGVKNDLNLIREKAGDIGAALLLDASQWAPHFPVDVKEWDVDFLVFTGHKMCGPTGIGVLYGKRNHLEAMPVFLGGGGMVGEVGPNGFTAAAIPEKFEAGTPPIAEAVGLAAAVDYLTALGWDKIRVTEEKSAALLLRELKKLPFLKIFGAAEAPDRLALVSFAMDGVHPHDIAELLSNEGICVRSGAHCAHPLMEELQVGATTRASLYFYNTETEIYTFIEILSKIHHRFH